MAAGPNTQSFYLVDNWARATASGKEFLNEADVCWGSGATILSPPSIWDRGFRPYTVRPRFRISERLGRRVPDIEKYGGYWLISEAAKQVLDTVSPDDFTYLPIDVEVDPGCDPVSYWLCDIVTILDAVDEEQSERLRIEFNDQGQKLHNILYASTVFHESVVGSHNAFRLFTSPDEIVCTEGFKEAYKAAGLKGQLFLPAYEPPFETTGTIREVSPSIRPGGRSWGLIKPDGRGATIVFGFEAVDVENGAPTVGQRVHVRGHRMKFPSRGRVADRVTRI
jgi:hypothetical protein